MPLRVDAQRNLERVLDAATEAFTEDGPDTSIDEIARRAGVGHATVFRRFPTKEALIAAVVERRVAELVGHARAALDSADPGEAFFDYAWKVGEVHAGARGLHACVAVCGEPPAVAELRRMTARLVLRAQEAGAVRSDVRPEDVAALLRGALEAAPARQWRRYLGVVLDGLRVRE